MTLRQEYIAKGLIRPAAPWTPERLAEAGYHRAAEALAKRNIFRFFSYGEIQ